MSVIRKLWQWVFIVLLIILMCSVYAVRTIKQGAEAYIFGYPLVLMELTRQAMEADATKGANHLYHLRSFPDHTFRNVVRPNNDTVYSVNWFDLKKEPMIISVPDSDRYYVLPFMDAWTNVFSSIGSRTTGNKAGHYALAGPDWRGKLPKDVNLIESPTNMVWMVGRIRANSQADMVKVAHMQDHMAITPLSQWAIGQPLPAKVVDGSSKGSDKRHPKALIDGLSAAEFFNLLSELMATQPAAKSDADALHNLSQLGVVPGKSFNLASRGFIDRWLIKKSVSIANAKLHEATDNQSTSPMENGWVIWRGIIGEYGTNYQVRAGVAMRALAALAPKEAAYPSASVDVNGEVLTGQNQYKIQFKKGQTPPAHAFWSITMYNSEGFLIDNPIKRYVIGDRNELAFNHDGSLDIYIQHTPPPSGESNWLPSPNGQFSILMRIYNTKQSFLDGSWQVPAIERIN